MSHEEELRVVQWQKNFTNTKQPLLASSSGAQMSNIAIKKPNLCTSLVLCNSSAVAALLIAVDVCPSRKFSLTLGVATSSSSIRACSGEAVLCVKLKVSVEVCRRMGERRWRVACRAGTEACGRNTVFVFIA